MAGTATLISLVAFVAELWVLVCCYAAGTAVGLSLGGLYLVVETLHLVPGTAALTAWLKVYLSQVTDAVSAPGTSRTPNAAADVSCSAMSPAHASSLAQAAAFRARQGFHSSFHTGGLQRGGSSQPTFSSGPTQSLEHAAASVEPPTATTAGHAYATQALAGANVTGNRQLSLPRAPGTSARLGEAPTAATAAATGSRSCVGTSTTAADAAQAAQETRAHDRAPSAAGACNHSATHATPGVLPLLPVSSTALEGDEEMVAVPSQASWGSALSSPVQPGHVSGHRATLQDVFGDDAHQQQLSAREVPLDDHPPKALQQDHHLNQQDQHSASTSTGLSPDTISDSAAAGGFIAAPDTPLRALDATSSSRTYDMFNAPHPAAAGAMRKQAVDTAAASVCEPAEGQPDEDAVAAGATSLRDQAGMRGAHTAAVVAGQENNPSSTGGAGISDSAATTTSLRDQRHAAAVVPLTKDTAAAALLPNPTGGVKAPDSRLAGKTAGGRSLLPGCFGSAEGTTDLPVPPADGAGSSPPASPQTRTRPGWLRRLRRAFQ